MAKKKSPSKPKSPSQTQPRVGADLLVESLEKHGVKHIFGIPGAKVDRVFDVLTYRGPELILCRHEQNAGFMAAAIGRLTGTPGVCLATSGPGATNLATALATATTEGDPVVAITGAVPRSMRQKKSHQSMDTASLFRPITKSSVEVVDASNISEVMANAFRVARAPRPGASYVTVPSDVLNDPTNEDVIDDLGVPALGAAPADVITGAAKILNKATLPVLFLGAASSRPDVAEAVRRFLRKHPIPVVGTYQASGVIPRDLLDCWVGRVGLFSNQPGDKLLAAADVIVTVGYDEVEYDPISWHKTDDPKIIHIDYVAADLDRHYEPVIEAIGDIASTIYALGRKASPKIPTKSKKFYQGLRSSLLAELNRGAKLNGAPIHPLRFISDLRANVDDDASIVVDIGSNYIWMARYFFSHRPRQLLFSNGQQTLGVALPWAMAATLARPGKKVISISGDGGFLFSAMELETAVRMKMPFVHFVWRDGTYNMVGIQQVMKYGRESGVAFGEPDLVAFAESFGAKGYRVNKPEELVPVLKQAMKADGPVIVDVPINYRDNPKLCATIKDGVIH